MHESTSKMQSDEDIIECYRICRNFQGDGARAVMRRLKMHFADKPERELLALIQEVEKLIRGDE